MPQWTVSKWTYAAIETTFSAVPWIGGPLTSILKLICQTEEQKRQEETRAIETLTQEEYDALNPPKENTVYLIVEKKGTES